VSKTDTAAREKIVAQLAVSGTQPSLEAMRLYHVGRLYERLDKQGEAQKNYEEAYARDPLAKQLADALVGLYMRTGAAEKAQKIQADYNKLNRELVLGTGPSFEKSDGSTPTLRGDLGQVLVGTGLILLAQDFDLAGRQMLQMARYANPQEPFASFYLGVADERMGRRDRALESYAAVPESSPLWFNAQLRRAEVLATHGHIEQAIDQLELLLKIRPNDAFVHRSLAEIYYHEKKFKQAVEHYNAIFAQVKIPTHEHVMLLFARGSGYERLGEITKATNDLQQALRIDPDNATLLNYLGYMWVDQNKNIEEAFAMISKAVDLSPNDGAIVDSLGWAYYKKNQYDLAVKYLERAVELEPVDATINSHLGDAYFKVGRLREAIVQWQRALKLNPQTDEERRHLERQLRDFAQEQTRR
jgi:tetratricopeptide (TPR) repeat protein